MTKLTSAKNNFIKVFLFLAICATSNSCKKDAKPPSTDFRTNEQIITTITTADLLNWKKTFGVKLPNLNWSNAQQSIIDSVHVVKIPVTNHSAIFFRKVNNQLEVFGYKWVDDKIGEKDFTGRIAIYNFQNSLNQKLVYSNGKIISEAVAGLKAKPNKSINSTVKVNVVDSNVIDWVWCWLTGGGWDYINDNCSYPEDIDWGDWDDSSDWLFQTGIIFGGGGGGAGSSGGGGTYGGGDVWISQYTPSTNPGCPTEVQSTKNIKIQQVPGGGTPPDCTGVWMPMIITLPGDVNSDPNFSFSDFSDINNPIDGSPTPILNNGTSIQTLNYSQPSTGRTIASISSRGNTEDMTYGTTSSTNGIKSEMINLSDWDLFNSMTEMFHKFTYFDGGLTTVGDQMIQKFKDKTGGSFEHPVLNARAGASSELQNFILNFGAQLNTQLKSNGGNISSIGTINLDRSIRPIFNGTFNKFHGLQILINDTESTDVQLDEFNAPIDGHWSATITVTIKDHFGLDRHDALAYQGYMGGFAGWWLLQHKRGYVPFETVVHVKYKITGNIN